MAKKNTPSAAKTSAAKAKSSAVVTTPVRNSAVPPKSAAIIPAPKKAAPTYEAVALRAYFMWKDSGGSEYDNWIRAERELSI